jgi:inner membrane transporter RhtA
MNAAGEQAPSTPAPAASSPGSKAGRLDTLPPELLIIAGALSVQLGASLAATLLRTYGALPVVSMRIVFGALILLPFQPIRLRGVSRAALASGVALGLILATMNSTFYVALSRIPLGVAVTIEFWGPLTLAVLGSRRWRDLVWVALAATGIYVLAGARVNADDAVGVAAVVVAGGCWALYILVGRKVAGAWPDGRGLSLAMVVASLVVVPATLALSDFHPLVTAPLAVAAGLVVALSSSAIPYTLEITALRRLPAATFGVLMSLEPAIAAIIGFLALGQVLRVPDLFAIACVVLASAGSSISTRRLATAPGELEAA